MTKIPRLGAKTARMLYQEYGIDSLTALGAAVEDGRLESVKGIGAGTIARIRKYIADQCGFPNGAGGSGGS